MNRPPFEWPSAQVYAQCTMVAGALASAAVGMLSQDPWMWAKVLVVSAALAVSVAGLGGLLDRKRATHSWEAPLRGFGIACLLPVILTTMYFVGFGVVVLIARPSFPTLGDLTTVLAGVSLASGVLLSLLGPVILPGCIWAAIEVEARRRRTPFAEPSDATLPRS